MQGAVLKIKKLGAPPEGFEDVTFSGDEGFDVDEILDLWEEYLIKCRPTDHMAGIEWSLLHCIESCISDIGLESPEEIERCKRLILWEEYQDAVVSIHTPVTWEEAEILIKCCPIDHMAGIEWSLLHCIESCTRGDVGLKSTEEIERYKRLISDCNSDMMRKELLKRLEASLSEHS